VARAAGALAANLAGRCRIPDLAAVLARSRALVSNDSGAGHVASAVGTPVISIFGPTVTSFGYTPFGDANRIVEHPGLACRPCDRHGPQVCPLDHFRCMREIGADRVLAALDAALAGARQRTDAGGSPG
jgi:heptosyltransferase-2